MSVLRVRIKRAYDKAEPGDGYRILIDHVWPRTRYREELTGQAERVDALRKRAAHAPLTLVYAARDREHNNAVVLAELLRDG